MPDAEGKLTPKELRDRWEEEPGISFRKEIIRQLQSEETEHKVDWEHLKVGVDGKEYIWEEFKGVKELKEILGSIRDLRGIYLSDANLERAYLFPVYLKNANPMSYHLENANLGHAHLEHAYLRFTHLEHAILRFAHLEHAKLYQAHLEHANLAFAHLEKTDLTDAHFELKSWRHRFKEIKISHLLDELFIPFTLIFGSLAVVYISCSLLWLMIFLVWFYNGKELSSTTILDGAELKNVKLDSDPVMYRELLDEQYLDRFAEKHPYLYPFWLLTSNCGRSISLVFLWSLLVIVLFGFIYSPLYLKYSSLTVDKICWWHPFYFSFVTMTTLGMASVEPGNFWAAFWHTLQNLFGYVWLGYLIAVLGSKLTRRSA